MSTTGRYTITAALPYTNGPIHIGHLAGVYIPADIYSRFLRMTGNDVAFICGSDEHGVPITIKAKKVTISTDSFEAPDPSPPDGGKGGKNASGTVAGGASARAPQVRAKTASQTGGKESAQEAVKESAKQGAEAATKLA